MAERAEGARDEPARSREKDQARERAASDETERSLARLVAIGLPALGLAGAIVVGVIAGIGSALLVVATCALLGTIALVWASVRTLSGDAPLALGLAEVGARAHGADALGERKRIVLRALKDLESERAVGKIEEGDYDVLVAKYREEAKAVMREMDLQVAPHRTEAEKLARAFLKKKGLIPETPAEEDDEMPGPRAGERVECEKCSTSNEPDASFCKKCGAALGGTKGPADADA
jgi:hypothetical protein